MPNAEAPKIATHVEAEEPPRYAAGDDVIFNDRAYCVVKNIPLGRGASTFFRYVVQRKKRLHHRARIRARTQPARPRSIA